MPWHWLHIYPLFSSATVIECCLSCGDHLHFRILCHQILLGSNQTGQCPIHSAIRVFAAWRPLMKCSYCVSCFQIIHRITFVNPPAITLEWKRKVAQDAIESLSAAKLAKSICSQFRTRLNSSHEAFAASLRQVSLPFSSFLSLNGCSTLLCIIDTRQSLSPSIFFKESVITNTVDPKHTFFESFTCIIPTFSNNFPN